MEVVLLWLDEIEDAVFAIASIWEPLRRALLQVGFCAAVALHFAWSAAYATGSVKVLAGVALASVVVWLAGLIVAALSRSLEPGGPATA